MTLAHPTAVLPLRALGLPTTAMVIGSMVPDIPVFVNWHEGYRLSHSVPGIFTIDLVMAVAVTALWFLAVREAVVDMAPSAVRVRLQPRIRPTSEMWWLTLPAAALGSITHLVWDSFTHVGKWGPRHIAWLADEHGPLLGLKWAQYVSGGVGLLVVTWVAALHLRSLAPLPEPRPRRLLPVVVLPAVVGAALVVGLVAAYRHRAYGFIDMAFDGVVHSLIALAALGALACLGWHVVHAAVAASDAM
ncbi:DUF4184 family protein [Nocardioides sp. MH1]|uniref:DUF4184 family protein n=1 Tax=Nocardioides sp. MH1 TaxID=3242490 RepID=UPI003521CFF4